MPPCLQVSSAACASSFLFLHPWVRGITQRRQFGQRHLCVRLIPAVTGAMESASSQNKTEVSLTYTKSQANKGNILVRKWYKDTCLLEHTDTYQAHLSIPRGQGLAVQHPKETPMVSLQVPAPETTGPWGARTVWQISACQHIHVHVSLTSFSSPTKYFKLSSSRPNTHLQTAHRQRWGNSPSRE